MTLLSNIKTDSTFVSLRLQEPMKSSLSSARIVVENMTGFLSLMMKDKVVWKKINKDFEGKPQKAQTKMNKFITRLLPVANSSGYLIVIRHLV